MLLHMYKTICAPISEALCTRTLNGLRNYIYSTSYCVFFLDILLFNGLQGWIQDSVSFLASLCFPAWFQAAVFWWLLIRHRLPWSVSERNCRGKHKSPFICFFVCFFYFALWLYFKLSDIHNHEPLRMYFALTSFCVNFGCWRGLNMAVITWHYESHVSAALLPNVNDWRHRNFHDYHKNLIPRQEKRYECVHMCKTACACSACSFTVYSLCKCSLL